MKIKNGPQLHYTAECALPEEPLSWRSVLCKTYHNMTPSHVGVPDRYMQKV